MKRIKVLIIIFILIIIITGSSLILLNYKNNDSKGRVLTPEDKQGYTINPIYNKVEDTDIEESFNIVESVKSSSKYYTIKSLTRNYISVLMMGDKEELKLLLAPSFIKKYNINNNNILSIASIPKAEELMYTPTIFDMKEFSFDSNTIVYIVRGKVRLLKDNQIYDFNIMIETKSQENVYNIYPERFIIDNGFNKLKNGDIVNDFNSENIENRVKNTFSYVEEKKDKEMATQYFEDFKERILYYKDNAYDILDSDYSKKRFGSKDEFNNYLESNKIRLYLMYIDKYNVIKKDKYVDYICADKYQNIYTFRQKENNIMDYEVFLDNYTIVSEKDEKKYEDSNKTTKAKLNLNKIIAMINTKDYKAIYKYLNNDFRNNNFNSINDLKKYITNNFYEINSIKLENTNEQDNYIAFTCKLINQRNTSESKSVNILIGKTDNIDFEMSFSFE